jgi:hypothetical protein
MKKLWILVALILTVPLLAARAPKSENPVLSKNPILKDYKGTVKLKLYKRAEKKLYTVTVRDNHKNRRIHFGMRIVVSKKGSLHILMSDGTDVKIKELTSVSLWRSKKKGVFGIRISKGRVEAKIKSERFFIRTRHHEIGGKGLHVKVWVDKEGKLNLSCIEGSGSVSDKFGSVLSLDKDQKFTLKYNEGKDAFSVKADKDNKGDAVLTAGDKEYSVEPGSGLEINDKGEMTPIVTTAVPVSEEVEDTLEKAKPKEEIADVEPYQDAGELHEAPYVSPKKPNE